MPIGAPAFPGRTQPNEYTIDVPILGGGTAKKKKFGLVDVTTGMPIQDISGNLQKVVPSESDMATQAMEAKREQRRKLRRGFLATILGGMQGYDSGSYLQKTLLGE